MHLLVHVTLNFTAITNDSNQLLTTAVKLKYIYSVDVHVKKLDIGHFL